MAKKERNLNAAAKAKKDEFYTQLSDIEKEMRYYKEHFRNKTIFCNCDDPESSNFWRYFHLNFYLQLPFLYFLKFPLKYDYFQQEFENN